MKYYILFIAIIIFNSCNNIENEKIEDGYFEYKSGTWGSLEYKIEEKTIDSCEYIVIFGSNKANIIHKANCSNH